MDNGNTSTTRTCGGEDLTGTTLLSSKLTRNSTRDLTQLLFTELKIAAMVKWLLDSEEERMTSNL